MPDPLYHDQPIPQRGALPPAPDCSPRILEMQRIALKLTLRTPAARIFYEQARFMADYEDERTWHGRLHRSHPTYTGLTLAQLRGHFTWRARLRRAWWSPRPSPSPSCICRNLLHLVGADSAEAGFRALQALAMDNLEASPVLANLPDLFATALGLQKRQLRHSGSGRGIASGVAQPVGGR